MANTPRVMITSLRNGTATTVSRGCTTGFFASSMLKNINNKKATLQMIAKREKKEIIFMKNTGLNYSRQNNIILSD